MSFNKTFLPSVEELQKILENYGATYFYNMYGKADLLMGSQDSIEFVGMFTSKYEGNKGFKSVY
jgi:hypothetical protein